MTDIGLSPPVTQAPAQPRRERHCLECGVVLARRARIRGNAKMFCGEPCRKTFNNRRRLRGSEIYDLAMEWRFDLGRAGKSLSLLCTLLGRFHADDKARGRKSWSPSRRLANLSQSRVGR